MALPRLTGGGQDAVADQYPGAVRALDVPVRVLGQDVLDGSRIGDQYGGRPGGPWGEPYGCHAAEPRPGLGQQVDQVGALGVPLLDHGCVQLGDRHGSGVDGHGAPPGCSLRDLRQHGLYASGCVR
ncbi:hypothetical protein ACFQ0T_06730 [Kitasatospora gansuensis]